MIHVVNDTRLLMSSGKKTVISTMVLVIENLNLGKMATQVHFAIILTMFISEKNV